MMEKYRLKRVLKKLMLFLSLKALEQHIEVLREENAG